MTDHFSIIDGAITPATWMQERPVASAQATSVAQNYSTSGGGNKDDLVHTVTTSWTNDTGGVQWVHGWVTRGGCDVTLQARSRGYLADFHAVLITATATPAPVVTEYELVEVSRAGIGMDVGKGGSLGGGTGFAVAEADAPSSGAPFMPHSPGMFRVEPGETLWARVEVRFRTEFWENTAIGGGASGTESGFTSGDTRIDLFALPAITDPGPRPDPTVVGQSTDVQITDDTEVDVPAGVVAGDVLVAVCCSQRGQASALAPAEPGWVLWHSPARTEGLAGNNDVHCRIYWRVATGSEPGSYTFGNSFLSEAITHLIVFRDASALLDDGWRVASVVRKRLADRKDGHVCPSIDRAGQLLICLSYFGHAPAQAPITQTVPAGLTAMSAVTGAGSSYSSARLADPPRPTGEREFTPSKKPLWTGHSISVTMIVPGTKPS